MLKKLLSVLEANTPPSTKIASCKDILTAEKIVVYLKAVAPHDVNGNPRRCFVVWQIDTTGAHKTAVIDDGYAGDRVHETFPNALYLGEIETTGKEYKYLLKFTRKAS